VSRLGYEPDTSPIRDRRVTARANLLGKINFNIILPPNVVFETGLYACHETINDHDITSEAVITSSEIT